MIDLATMTTFLGWCTVINIGILTYSSIMTIVFNAFVKKLHAKMFHLSPEKVDETYFKFLGNYKLAIFIFNLVRKIKCLSQLTLLEKRPTSLVIFRPHTWRHHESCYD